MKAWLMALVLLYSNGVYALVCEVHSTKDAHRCLTNWSMENYAPGLTDHTVGVSSKVKAKDAFSRITHVAPQSHFVGVVQVHYEQDEVIYLELAKGDYINPQVIKSSSLESIPKANVNGLKFLQRVFSKPAFKLSQDDLESLEALYGLYIMEIRGEFHL